MLLLEEQQALVLSLTCVTSTNVRKSTCKRTNTEAQLPQLSGRKEKKNTELRRRKKKNTEAQVTQLSRRKGKTNTELLRREGKKNTEAQVTQLPRRRRSWQYSVYLLYWYKSSS